MKKLLARGQLLIITMALVMNSAVGEVPKSNHSKMIFTFLKQLDQKYQVIMEKVPANLVNDINDSRIAVTVDALEEDLSKLQSNGDFLEEYKNELIQKSLMEASVQKQEIKGQLETLSITDLNTLSEVFNSNPSYDGFEIEYQSAYTKTEKTKVIEKALFEDFDSLLTVNQKKIRKLSKENIIRNIVDSKNNLLLNTTSLDKSSNSKKKVLMTLAIAGSVILIAGIFAWAKYGGKYAAAKSDREKELETLRKNLEKKYSDFDAELSIEEMQYLAENGFIRTLCGNYDRPSSKICNGLNYSVVSGNIYCNVYCYKNINTGKETLHESPVCTTPFIPTNCDDPSEYYEGYNKGYDIGYDYGWDDGSHDGTRDGREDGDYDGYNDGLDDGWDWGYDDGYSDAMFYGPYFVSPKINLEVSPLGITPAKGKRYDEGFLQGKKDADLLKNFNMAI